MKQTLLSFLLALLPIVASADAVEIGGIYYNLIPKGKVAEVTGASYSGDINIPATITYESVEYSVTSIGDGAFSGANVNTVNMPNSITYIGRDAFSCSSISSITMPNSVKSTGIYVFYSCPNLKSITLSNQLTSISDYLFWGCSNLLSIEIPESVTSIGYHSFSGCSSLESIIIPNSVTNISATAFWGCSKLKTLSLSSNISSIQGYTFCDCTSLTNLLIPNNVQTVGEYDFHGCTNLETIILGSSMNYLSNNSFSNCPNLKDVYCYASIPPYVAEKAFDGSYIEYVTLHVPESAIEQYKTTAPWSSFKNFVGVTDTNHYFEMAITVNNAHGTVSFGDYSLTDGTQTYNVKEGSDVVLTLTADEDYKLASVTVDGVDKTADVVDGVLTVSDVAADMTVNVRFITVGETAAVTIGEAGMATICSAKDLDFSEVDGLSAYTGAGFNRETGVLTMLKVTDAPAGTGLIVKGSEGTYEIPVKTSVSVYANLLVGVTEETTLSQTAGGYVNYILANGSHGPGFYVVEGEGTLAAGKAYLRLPAAVAGSSRAIAIEFAEDATGIEGISGDSKTTTDEWFDLQGRRMAKPTKAGVYLNNGHKIVVR